MKAAVRTAALLTILAAVMCGSGGTCRIGLADGLGPGAVVLGPGAGPARIAQFAAPADAAALEKAIADKIAKLNIKPSPVESADAKATRARQAIKQGDFATAGKIVSEVLTGSKMQAWRFYPFDSFIACFACRYDPQLGKRLDEWVAKSPGDAIPLLMRADFFFDAGWSKRGQRMVRETPESQIESFTGYMDKALADVNAAMAVDKANPYSYYLKLLILSSHGFSKEMGRVFEEGIAKYPNYFSLYHVTLDALAPKWGGSVEAMYAFVERYAGGASEDSPLKMLYLALYRNLLDNAFIACSNTTDNDVVAPCIAIHMKEDPAPKVEHQIGKALALYDHYDHQDYNGIVYRLLKSMLQVYGADQYAEAVLQQAAAATHSSLEIAPNRTGSNDYIIDEFAAITWHHRMLFDNAIEKTKQALRDAETTDFPNPGEKTETIAGLYDELAMYVDDKNQYLNTVMMGKQENQNDHYVDMVAYEMAALQLSPTVQHGYLACMGYAALRLFEQTISSCSVVLNNSENVQARYWRAIAYQQTNQLDAALRDFTVVADSNNKWRIMAGMQMVAIYETRKDWKSLLDTLDEYRFMYNPMYAAFTYDSRCHAHQELGELQKALDDCTEALKHSRLPDAYQRQQELIQQLSKH